MSFEGLCWEILKGIFQERANWLGLGDIVDLGGWTQWIEDYEMNLDDFVSLYNWSV